MAGEEEVKNAVAEAEKIGDWLSLLSREGRDLYESIFSEEPPRRENDAPFWLSRLLGLIERNPWPKLEEIGPKEDPDKYLRKILAQALWSILRRACGENLDRPKTRRALGTLCELREGGNLFDAAWGTVGFEDFEEWLRPRVRWIFFNAHGKEWRAAKMKQAEALRTIIEVEEKERAAEREQDANERRREYEDNDAAGLRARIREYLADQERTAPSPAEVREWREHARSAYLASPPADEKGAEDAAHAADAAEEWLREMHRKTTLKGDSTHRFAAEIAKHVGHDERRVSKVLETMRRRFREVERDSQGCYGLARAKDQRRRSFEDRQEKPERAGVEQLAALAEVEFKRQYLAKGKITVAHVAKKLRMTRTRFYENPALLEIRNAWKYHPQECLKRLENQSS
jgi:hypothetical protein